MDTWEYCFSLLIAIAVIEAPLSGMARKAVDDVAKTGTNLVYEGFDAAGTVRYVGITEREAAVRFSELLSSGTGRSLLDYRVVEGATNLTRAEARIWEQTLINQYGLV
jgi:hypothetical protein